MNNKKHIKKVKKTYRDINIIITTLEMFGIKYVNNNGYINIFFKNASEMKMIINYLDK